MSKKKLLEESTIRSFMKLANLQPLTDKFLKESGDLEEVRHVSDREDDERAKDRLEEEALEEETLEEDSLEESEALEEDSLEEEMQEEGDMQAEGREGGDKTPSSPRPKVKGTAKPTKVKGAHADHKMTAAKTGGSHHTSDTDTISTKNHSVARKKNNSQFELVSESMDEEMDQADMGGAEGAPEAPEAAGSGGESPEHKQKMKELINTMLDNLKNMASEYGVDMEISRGGEGEMESPEAGMEAPEAGMEAPEGEQPQEKLDEMIEKLTQRVAARLVKESKKKR